jgi:hypothetical protein
LEYKQRNVDTAEVTEALDFLQPHIRPTWLVPQYRHALEGHGELDYEREGQQQVLRPSFDGKPETGTGLSWPSLPWVCAGCLRGLGTAGGVKAMRNFVEGIEAAMVVLAFVASILFIFFLMVMAWGTEVNVHAPLLVLTGLALILASAAPRVWWAVGLAIIGLPALVLLRIYPPYAIEAVTVAFGAAWIGHWLARKR